MLYSTFLKNTRLTMLLTTLLFITHFLSAQVERTVVFPPLSILPINVNHNTIYTISEFSTTPQLNTAISSDTTNRTIDTSQTVLVATVEKPQTVTDSTKAKAAAVVAAPEDNRIFDDSTCIDLVFDSVSVIQIAEKFIEIEYTIINKGTAPAPLFGTKKSVKDNVAVHFYFSGTPRLNRGSILAEGIFLTEGLRETKGMLAPNTPYKNRFKLPLEKKNRFYGVVILQLDAFDILRRECDETNNVFSIVPKWY